MTFFTTRKLKLRTTFVIRRALAQPFFILKMRNVQDIKRTISFRRAWMMVNILVVIIDAQSQKICGILYHPP